LPILHFPSWTRGFDSRHPLSVMSRDMTDTANPRELSSPGFSHVLVALRQVDRRLGDELTFFRDDPDVIPGDVEAHTGSRPGSAHPEVEHPIAEPQADLAADVDLVVADAEVRIDRRHAGCRLVAGGVGGSRGDPPSSPVGPTFVVVLDDAVHLGLELGDGCGRVSLGQESLEGLVAPLDLAAGLGLRHLLDTSRLNKVPPVLPANFFAVESHVRGCEGGR